MILQLTNEEKSALLIAASTGRLVLDDVPRVASALKTECAFEILIRQEDGSTVPYKPADKGKGASR